MTKRLGRAQLTDSDLDFVIAVTAPGAKDPERLKAAIREDETFREALVGDERLFQRLLGDQEQLVRVSPLLYFEVLLRKSRRELQHATHTVERTGSQRIPVFDSAEVAALLQRPEVLDYLADMLASFTRIRSYTQPVRVRQGLWRRVRYNDADLDSLLEMCEMATDEERLAIYKRIGDLCLFVLGVFPEHAPFDQRYPSGALRPMVSSRMRRGLEDFESEGKRFYRLAGEHPAARESELSDVLLLMHEKFSVAKKPLTFISQHYLQVRRQQLFKHS